MINFERAAEAIKEGHTVQFLNSKKEWEDVKDLGDLLVIYIFFPTTQLRIRVIRLSEFINN